MDMWKAISEDTKSPRTEFVYNIDDEWKYGAIRRNKWKYLYGSFTRKDSWYGSPGNDSHYHYDVKEVLESKTGTSLAGVTTYQQIHEKHNNFKHKLLKKSDYSVQILDEALVKKLRENATVKCKDRETLNIKPEHQCHPNDAPCLFNVRDDPCELVNLANENPLIMSILEDALVQIKKTMVPPINKPQDPKANPALHNGTWTNWNDLEDIQREKIPFDSLSPLAIGLIATACVVFLIVIVVLLAITLRRNNGNKFRDSDIFSSLEDARDQPTTELTLKSCELTHIPYRETTIKRGRE